MNKITIFLIGLGIFIIVSIIIIIIIKLTNNKSTDNKSTDNKSTDNKSPDVKVINILPSEDCILSEWSTCNKLNQYRTVIKNPSHDLSKCPTLYKSCDNYTIVDDIITIDKKYYRIGLKLPIKTTIYINHITNVFDAIINSIKNSIVKKNIESDYPIILVGISTKDFSVFNNYMGQFSDIFSPMSNYPGFINNKYNYCSDLNENVLVHVVLNMIYNIGLSEELINKLNYLHTKYNKYYEYKMLFNSLEFFCYFYYLFLK